jgi:hypothetical protein
VRSQAQAAASCFWFFLSSFLSNRRPLRRTSLAAIASAQTQLRGSRLLLVLAVAGFPGRAGHPGLGDFTTKMCRLSYRCGAAASTGSC